MSKKALCIFAEGFEEIEAVTPVDLVRRAGIEVVTAGLTGVDITGSHGIAVITDCTLDDIDDAVSEFDAVIIPGGIPGAVNISQDYQAMKIVTDMFENGKLVAAICASPAVVLGSAGILSGKKTTSAPGFVEQLPKDADFTGERVTVDSNIITSRGAGTAGEFAFAVIEYLEGKEAAEKIKAQTLYK